MKTVVILKNTRIRFVPTVVFYLIGAPSLSVTQTKLIGPLGLTQHLALARWMMTITGFLSWSGSRST